MAINIWGKYENNQPEKIDMATNKQEANYLVNEYIIAFGKGWIIWQGRKKDLTNNQ